MDNPEEAEKTTEDKPEAVRSGNFIERFLPPAPPGQVPMRRTDLKQLIRKRHNTRGLVMIVIVVVLAVGIGRLVPWARYSILSLVTVPLTHLLEKYFWWIEGILMAFLLYVIWASKRGQKHKFKAIREDVRLVKRETKGLFGQLGLHEEQVFREGAENWTWLQRLQSCVVFGFAHLFNLIYPLSVIPSLMLSGAMFMAVYLRELRQTSDREAAVLEAAITHRAYNRFAGWLLLGAIAWGVLYPVFGESPPGS